MTSHSTNMVDQKFGSKVKRNFRSLENRFELTNLNVLEGLE